MNISVVYVYPANSGPQHEMHACRFLESYHANPPGIDHSSVIVLNGAKANSEITCQFCAMPKCMFLEHDDSGWDIGAYQLAARKVSCDLMVFIGGSTYIRHPGWLLRIATSVQRHGNALYGFMGNRGDPAVRVSPHIRTTGFWMTPESFNRYPIKVTRQEQRYEFEHGRTCLTTWAIQQGMRAWVVSMNGEYGMRDWDDIPNGFHRGNQSALLFGDRITEIPYRR